MTTPAAIVSLKTNAPLRNLVILGTAVVSWTAAVFGWSIWSAYSAHAVPPDGLPSRLQIVSAYLAPFFGCLFTWLLIRISRQGNVRRQWARLWWGSVFIAGAAVFDLSVTFYFSPDLVDEGNPVVRALLDSGHSLFWVVTHMLVSTLAVVGTFCAFWGAYLAHQPFLLSTIRDDRPAGCLGFLKSATGGGNLTLRQWLFPCRWSELPRPYHGIWMTGIAIVFGVTIFRYYVCLEWLGIIEPDFAFRLIALFIGVAGSLIAYHIALAVDYRTFAKTGIPDSP